MSLRGRLKKRIQIEAPEVTDLISKDGQFEEGGVSISKSGMSISSVSSVSSASSVSSTSSAGFASPIPTSDEDIKLDDLELLEDIGRGSGGVVKKVLHKVSGKLMALKIIPLDVNSQVRKRILLELKTLYHSQSPHIVNFYGAFFTEGHIYICLELMDAGSLHSLLEMTGPFPEPVIAEVSKQVLKGLHYLHKERHLVHRDIKPSNILVNSAGEVKISDFGVSGQLASSISSCVSWVGTVTYMSPERIQGQSHSTQSDIWSLGLSIFELALGRFPYLPPGAKLLTREAGLGFWELLDQIVKQDTPQLPQGVYSPQLASFISACLCKDPDQRPSASDLLEHPFIKNSSPKNFDLSGWICQYVKPSNPPLSSSSPLSSTSEPSLKTTESNPEKDKEKRLPEGVASLRVSLSGEIGEKKLTATRSKEFKRLERSESGEGEKKADVSMMMMKKLF